MLAARRDPPFHSSAQDLPYLSAGHATHAPHAARFMTALQMIGSLLAIPVGLASGYSIYHANFSAEARCQGLRANIVSMLDKSADAATLRTLVRRDVASFEANCGAVDPDAVAAFRTLLAAGRAVQPARAVAPQAEIAKPQTPAVAKTEPVKRGPASTDARWVASVQKALMHAPAVHVEEFKSARARVPAPRPYPLDELRGFVKTPTAVSAPALPSAASVAPTLAPAPDHPVPPASIPKSTPVEQAVPSAPLENRLDITGLIAKIPLLGRAVGR